VLATRADHPRFDLGMRLSLSSGLAQSNTYTGNFLPGPYLTCMSQYSAATRGGEPEKKRPYLISLGACLTENAYWPQHFSEEQRKDWQQLLPALLDVSITSRVRSWKPRCKLRASRLRTAMKIHRSRHSNPETLPIKASSDNANPRFSHRCI